jgi:hypothetical protein
MNEYNSEQFETLTEVRRQIDAMRPDEKANLIATLDQYLAFRREVDAFQASHFSDICTEACYRSRLSACCSREGIITFFADVVINALLSSPEALNRLEQALQRDYHGFKCVYLGGQGCLWHLKPVICGMFLCDQAQQRVFEARPDLQSAWEQFKQKKQRFTWPDRPVLFDDLESYFIKRGCTSALMYLHNSPGLLRVKKQAGSIGSY